MKARGSSSGRSLSSSAAAASVMPSRVATAIRTLVSVRSQASSEGAYLTKDIYFGAHGRSRRLAGLDPQNNQAEPRGIVVHGAWYVSPELAARGAIGRSEGCFAFQQDQVGQIIDRLGAGRMILAMKA